MTMITRFRRGAALVTAVLGALSQLPSLAAAGADEAQKLKTTLTPLGAERAGNKDGSIPAWEGCPKLDAPLAKLKAGDRRWDPFASEKPLYVVTADNMSQYADKLSDGLKALLQKYPKTMRLPVYKTHRTHCAPDWVNEATLKNATSGKLAGDAAYSGVEGAINGIPFPIPKNGLEVRWNVTLRWRGQSFDTKVRHLSWTTGGDKVLGSQALQYDQMEFYRQGITPEQNAQRGYMDWMFYQNTDAPSFRAGELLVTRGTSNYDKVKERGSWQYLVGQRRVRRAPTVGWDTPDFVNSGANFFDEVFGSPMTPNERYEYKLVGKKEMLIPYNDNKIFGLSEDEIFGKQHHNPDALRWELHRVWVVEATLAAGKRHAVPKRVHYIDEDTWGTSLMDGYDANGKPWRVSINPAYYFPDMPGVMSAYSDILYVLDAAYSTRNMSFYEVGMQMKPVPMKSDSVFTPDAIAAGGVR